MSDKKFKTQYGRSTSGRWHRAALNAVHRIRRLCGGRGAEPSFGIIRVNKISSGTPVSLMTRRKPTPHNPPVFGTLVEPSVPSSGLTLSSRSVSQAPCPQPAPAVLQRGLVADGQGGWEYRSVYRMGLTNSGSPAQNCQGQLAPESMTGRKAAPQMRSGPRISMVVGSGNLATAKCYIPFRPSANTYFSSVERLRSGRNPSNLTNGVQNANPGIPSGRSTAEFANTSPAGTPFHPNPTAEAVTLPKAVHRGGHPTPDFRGQVSQWQGRWQPRPMIAEHRPFTPCNIPLIVVTPASPTRSRREPTDDRRTLPSQRPRQQVVGPLPKIVSPDVHVWVTQREPHATSRPCPTLRRRPGNRSLFAEASRNQIG